MSAEILFQTHLVPLMITHVAAFYLLVRAQPKVARALAGDVAAS